jgi:hypothetical protein
VNDSNRSTPEARLLDAGWEPPKGLRTAIERREALRSAIDALKTRGHADNRPVLTAFGEADRDGIVSAIVSTAIGSWLDSQCQRPETELTAWSGIAEQAVIDAIYAAGQSVLDSLEGIDSPDAAYVRSTAEQATTLNSQFVSGSTGQPLRARPGTLGLFRTMVPR